MSLRVQAESDLSFMLEDNATGFGWPITITDPDNNTNTNPLYGSSMDIGLSIDPDTGMLVDGQRVTVALRISSLSAQSLGIPKAIPDEDKRPWRVTFDDINGQPSTFKVSSSQIDRSAGVVVCTLENYIP